MTYSLFDTETRRIVSVGHTLAMARFFCLTNPSLIFLPGHASI